MDADDAVLHGLRDRLHRRHGERAPRTRLGRWWSRPRSRGQRAFVLIWMALLLTLLIAVAGFAVDMSNWWLASERLQSAVDSGAHAGAVFLPGDVTNAKLQARKKVALNGYNDGINAGPVKATVVVTQQQNPYQLKVEATTTVDNVFLAIIGFRTQTVKRDAIGQFEQPVAMGSPKNKVGDDPVTGDIGSEFWVNVSGPGTDKTNGDRYASKNCPTTTAKCTGTVISGINNDEFKQDNYFFTAEVKSVVSGQNLVFQVFDGEYANVGLTCTIGTWPSSGERTTLAGLPGNPYPQAAAAFVSGNAGTQEKWCVGDHSETSGTATADGTRTTYIVRSPDDTPWSNTDNPVVSTATCAPQELPNFPSLTGNNSLYNLLHPTNGINDAQGVVNPAYGTYTFASTFRRWATLCTIPAGSVQVGEYLLQIRSDAHEASPTTYDASMADKGANNFSLRVGFGLSGATAYDGTNVSISARQRLPIYANATGATTTFYLARVTPADAGRTVRVTLFDMGDAGSGAIGTLQFFPPSETGGTFANCGFKMDNGGTLTWATGCKLTNVHSTGTVGGSAGYQGRSVDIDIPIPQNYTCTDTSPTGCWITVVAAFNNSQVHDTTTWSAAILGSPVRLIE